MRPACASAPPAKLTIIIRSCQTACMTDVLSSSSERPPSVRFCIPDTWFRRKPPRPSSIQSRSSATTDVSSSCMETIDNSSAEEKEGEGTAKQSKSTSGSRAAAGSGSPEWRGSVAQNRLTSLLAGWSQSAPAPAPAPAIASTSVVVATSTGNRKSVSEPLLIRQNTGGSVSTGESVGSGEFDSEEFERCMVSGDPFCFRGKPRTLRTNGVMIRII